MKANSLHSFGRPGLTRTEVFVVICVIFMVFAGLFHFARLHKIESDRSAVILNIRNCQQAMRGHQGMRQLYAGQPFTRKDVEGYMKFPTNINTLDGTIEFIPGTVVTRESGDPATNGNHLWLQIKAPHTEGYVGRYGWDDIGDVTGW